MNNFTVRPKSEIEKLREKSIAVMAERARKEWADEYQEICDRTYWELGQCCAGCDHWDSYAGNSGLCTVAPPVSGDQVMKSLGLHSSSYTPEPGHPYTRADHKCGAFKDDFDWSTLPQSYLVKVGAIHDGKLKPKPAGVVKINTHNQEAQLDD